MYFGKIFMFEIISFSALLSSFGLVIGLIIGSSIGKSIGYEKGRQSFIEESGYHTVYDDRVQVKTHDQLGRKVTLTVFSDAQGDYHKHGFLIRSERDPIFYGSWDTYDTQFRDVILANPYEDQDE